MKSYCIERQSDATYRQFLNSYKLSKCVLASALISKHAGDVAASYQLQQRLSGQAAVTDQRFDFRWVETRPGHHQDALNPDQQRALEAVRQVRAVSVPSQVITLNNGNEQWYVIEPLLAATSDSYLAINEW